MIGNLGKATYESVTVGDGNSGNGGNITREATLLHNQNTENVFPIHKVEMVTSGTDQQQLLPFLQVPDTLNTNGNGQLKHKNIKKQVVVKHVPVVPDSDVIIISSVCKPVFGQIPRGHGIWKIADICGERVDVHSERNTCYCCRGTEFWALEANSSANWICSRCHPPVVDSKKIIWRRSASLQTGNNQLTASKPNLMALRLIGELRKALDDINAIFPGPDCWQWIQQQPDIIDSLQSVKPLINAPFLPENESKILEAITKWKSIHINAFITYKNRK